MHQIRVEKSTILFFLLTTILSNVLKAQTEYRDARVNTVLDFFKIIKSIPSYAFTNSRQHLDLNLTSFDFLEVKKEIDDLETERKIEEVSRNPTDYNNLILRLTWIVEQADPDQLLEHFKTISELDIRGVVSYLFSRIYSEKDKKSALNHIEKALIINRYIEEYYLQQISLLNRNQYSKSLTILDAIISFTDQEWTYREMKYLLLASNNRKSEAIDELTRAIKSIYETQDFGSLNEDLVSSLPKDISNVVAQSQSGLKNSELGKFFLKRANLYHELNEFKEACKDINKAFDLGIDVDPDLLDKYCK